MGVSGLLGLLKSIQKPCHLRDFGGQTVGVDAYGWLHRGAIACAGDLAQGKPTTKFVDFCMHRVRMLIHFGVTPYLVFDGDRLPSKAETERARAERRKASLKAALQLQSVGKIPQAYQEFQKAVDISPQLARQLIDELKRHNIQYIVAPFEADAQLAFLEAQGKIDAVASEDSDLLVFGVKTLLTKLDQYGECVMIRQADFTQCRDLPLAGWSMDDFRRMCILSGCDYVESIPKMGLKTAARFTKRYKTIDSILRGISLEAKMRVPTDYRERFVQAERTFLHHWVFCPNQQALVNLTSLSSPDLIEEMSYLGTRVPPEIARRVARGDVDPMTKKTLFSVPAQPIQRPSLMPSTPLAKPNPPGTLDSFLKRRDPLAEIDPNTVRHSPSQQTLLARNQSRVWNSPSASAPQPARPTMLQTLTPSPQSVPSKRRRLCSDALERDAGDASDRMTSRFFGPQCQKQALHPLRENTPGLGLDDISDPTMGLVAPHSFIASASLNLRMRRARAIQVFEDPQEDSPPEPVVLESESPPTGKPPPKKQKRAYESQQESQKPFVSNKTNVTRIQHETKVLRFAFKSNPAHTLHETKKIVSAEQGPSASSAIVLDKTRSDTALTQASHEPESSIADEESQCDSPKRAKCQELLTPKMTYEEQEASKARITLVALGSEDQCVPDSEEDSDFEPLSWGNRGIDIARFSLTGR